MEGGERGGGREARGKEGKGRREGDEGKVGGLGEHDMSPINTYIVFSCSDQCIQQLVSQHILHTRTLRQQGKT